MFQVVGHHQWLTLSACVLMWGPYLIERLFNLWVFDYLDYQGNVERNDEDSSGNDGDADDDSLWRHIPKNLSVFLFLLGHTHNLLRSVLHAVFAQQIHSLTWKGNDLDLYGGPRSVLYIKYRFICYQTSTFICH